VELYANGKIADWVLINNYPVSLFYI